jgi:hypothetical protein
MNKNRPGSGENFVQKDDFEVQQEALWRWAAERVPPWGKVQKDDYDFSSWMKKNAREELLNAGCLYEYARESHKFRCVLVLNNRKREERSGTLMWIEYEGNSAGNVHLIRGGWDRWLGDFADELIANKSFAQLLRTSRSKVEKSLDALAGYNLYPKAVELPRPYKLPEMQEVVIQIDWRHYDNKEIGAEMTRWAANNRPESEPEPDRTGKKRESKVRADLKALSALRIWKLHRRKPWKRLEHIAEFCGYKGCVREFAEYNQRRNRGHAVEPISNQARTEMSAARARALNLFQRLFPWGRPLNY